MKKIFLPLSFFIFGIGVSYFTFNHNIVNKKIQFNEEISALFDTNISAEEANGRIFQLLFAYFAIDLRDVEDKITTKIQESIEAKEGKVVEKVVEKIVYLPQEKSIEKKKEVEVNTETEILEEERLMPPVKNFKSLERLNFKEYLKDTSPILERDKAFETLNGTHRFIGHNNQGPNFQIEIENLFKLVNKTYRGTSKIDYLVLGKSEDAIMVDGMPLNFLKNPNYPNLVTARVSKDRFIVINTKNKFYDDEVRGVLFLRNGENFKKDGLLRSKSKL